MNIYIYIHITPTAAVAESMSAAWDPRPTAAVAESMS